MDCETSLANLISANACVSCSTLKRLNQIVLDDPLFQLSPGGSEHHHNYKHGLVIHVAEVMCNVFFMSSMRPSDELITAVIWHDYMKTEDYSLAEDGSILKNPYRRMIGHLAGSAMEFHAAAHSSLNTETLQRIEHLLLSHHGRREWGAPVEPATAEAFILHSADMMSAKGCNL